MNMLDIIKKFQRKSSLMLIMKDKKKHVRKKTIVYILMVIYV